MKTEMLKKAAFTLKIVVLLFILLLSKAAKEEKSAFDSEQLELSAVPGSDNSAPGQVRPPADFIRKVSLTDAPN